MNLTNPATAPAPKNPATIKAPVGTPLTTEKLTVLGWIVFLIALMGFNHTKTGHEIIFYAMVLIVLYLFLVNNKAVLGLLTKQG